MPVIGKQPEMNMLILSAVDELEFHRSIAADEIDRIAQPPQTFGIIDPLEIKRPPKEMETRGGTPRCRRILFGRPGVRGEDQRKAAMGANLIEPDGRAIIDQFGMPEFGHCEMRQDRANHGAPLANCIIVCRSGPGSSPEIATVFSSAATKAKTCVSVSFRKKRTVFWCPFRGSGGTTGAKRAA